jgi:hypothetical protein
MTFRSRVIRSDDAGQRHFDTALVRAATAVYVDVEGFSGACYFGFYVTEAIVGIPHPERASQAGV